MSSERERALVPVLLGLTAVTGLVDAVSVLGLGRVFTANMTYQSLRRDATGVALYPRA
jgi:uncharacterized membrane protein YoaK (UPF0700 family)